MKTLDRAEEWTRRGFLGATLMAVPCIRAVACLVPVVESQYYTTAKDFPPLVVTTFTNGTLKAEYRGEDLKSRKSGKWIVFTTGDRRPEYHHASTRVRRVSSTELHVDWIMMQSPREDHS